ncbi:MAG TPA: flagellar M-ring protein FliF C-terminal domain-containing protein, partial [Bacillota bacterium]|nr:flagellar M-ring protein FliF C-terminal domain-containing protein [Bacillota bacterium]
PEGTASVQLQLRAPGILSESQAESIANLLASSTGIKPENVTIIDNYANDLTAFMRSKRGFKSGMVSTSQLFSAKMEYETTAEKRLEGMLTKVFGFNKAVVRVNAELDLDYQEIKSETWGDQGVPRSEQEKTETSQATGGSAAGVAGADSNITQYKAGDNRNNQFNSDKTERTVNYEINRKEEFRIAAPGAVKRQTVGVWVDGDLPAATKQKVENTVAAAIGIMNERGDRLTVETIKFTPPPQPEPVKTQLNIPWQQVVLYLILAVFLWGLLSTFRKIINVNPGQPQPNQSGVGARVDTLVTGEEPVEPVMKAPEISPEEKVRIERLQTLEKVAMDKPEEVAALLKNWISEDY